MLEIGQCKDRSTKMKLGSVERAGRYCEESRLIRGTAVNRIKKHFTHTRCPYRYAVDQGSGVVVLGWDMQYLRNEHCYPLGRSRSVSV